MKEASDERPITREKLLGSLCRKLADSDDPFRLKNPHKLAQMLVANSEERFAFAGRQFVGGAVPSRAFNEGKWAVIGDEMLGEELFCHAESAGKQSP